MGIGRKFNLLGGPATLHLVDFVLDQCADFDAESTRRCYGDFKAMKPYCANDLPYRLRHFTKILGGKKFITGDTVTVADLKLNEAQPEISTKTLEDFPEIVAFMCHVEALPALKGYFASEEFMPRPLNNAHAQFK